MATVTDVTSTLEGTALSIANYDATLNGWAAQNVVDGLTLGAQNLFYSAAGATARADLVNTDRWTILDSGTALVPQILFTPSVAPMPYGTALANSMLIGGSADVNGVFTFTQPGTVLDAGTHQVPLTFTPENQQQYQPASSTVEVEVTQLTQALALVTGPASGSVLIHPQSIPFEVTSTASLPVAYATTGSCSISSGSLMFTAIGTCIVTASQAGTANVSPATDLVIEYSVLRADAPPVANFVALAVTGIGSTYLPTLALFAILIGIAVLRRREV